MGAKRLDVSLQGIIQPPSCCVPKEGSSARYIGSLSPPAALTDSRWTLGQGSSEWGGPWLCWQQVARVLQGTEGGVLKERLEQAGTETGLPILCSAVICSSCLAFSISEVPQLSVAVGLGDFTGIDCHGLCCSSPLTIAGIWGLLVVVLDMGIGLQLYLGLRMLGRLVPWHTGFGLVGNRGRLARCSCIGCSVGGCSGLPGARWLCPLAVVWLRLGH